MNTITLYAIRDFWSQQPLLIYASLFVGLAGLRRLLGYCVSQRSLKRFRTLLNMASIYL